MEKYLEKIKPTAEALGLDIIDAELISNELLELSIARKDFKPVDLEICAKAGEAFGEALDYEIGLDVGSAGAERIILEEDYDNVVDQYVLIKFKNPIQGADYVEGTVISVDENEVVVSYRQKTALKKIAIERLNIKMLRLAVKV
ncbi:ribosome maturation factor RimP [Erysipelothrix rhusiopathiae]|uniref:ribosome maturation factor RimP n=1 Tax=Erysipelothrix rhusiopathiae TaxID=1648 RepID=UPI003D35312A